MKIRWRYRLLSAIVGAVAVILLLPAAAVGAFRFIDPPTTAYMWRVAHSDDVAVRGGIHQRWLDFERMPACMPLAVVAAEDQTFPSNYGFAWRAIKKAVIHDLKGGDLRGASTITQQTAKNLFLWPTRSLFRKGVEAYITAWMVALWPKRRVMSVYLNTVQFGDRTFGVAAAARQFFNVSAGQLTRRQCARLAAVLPNPAGYSAVAPSADVRRRARWILGQMNNLGAGYLNRTFGRH